MTSKRHVKAKSAAVCARKVGYPTKASAAAALGAMHRKGIYGLRVYKCATCRKRHLGHYGAALRSNH